MDRAYAPFLVTKGLNLRAYQLVDFHAFAGLYGSDRSQYLDGSREIECVVAV